MRLRYEPNLAAGGVTGAIMALLVYYKVLDVEGAGLWAVVLAAVAPLVQGWAARFFTTSKAKLADADAATGDSRYHPETINQRAAVGREIKGTGRGGGPSTSRGSHAPPR